MKSFYQPRGNRGFLLNKNVYRKIRYTISCYNFWVNLCEKIETKSPQKITESDVNNKAVAEKYIPIIKNALINYVPTEYQKAVWEHTVNGAEYEDLENKYYISQSTMKKYTQQFVWGVAYYLGEDFTEVN